MILLYFSAGIATCALANYLWVDSGKRLDSIREDWKYYIAILCFWPLVLVAMVFGEKLE